MMGIEFMTGAAMFALVNLIGVLLFLFFFFRGGKKIYKDFKGYEKCGVPIDLYYLMIIGMLFVFFGSSVQPKFTIETPINRELIEYQGTNERAIVETPAPRTETLQGFTPLKE
jgi:hypothetical protein